MTCAADLVDTPLRERKRAETRSALVLAAYTIVRDSGIEAVTAEAVADRAGVSRRTFFNYFPSVESVLTASICEFFTSLAQSLQARPAEEPVRESLLRIVDGSTDPDLLERIGVLAAAGEASPTASALILTQLHQWLEWLEVWLRGRLGPGLSELHIATLAGCILAASEAAFRVWFRRSADERAASDPTYHAMLDHALGHLGPGLLPEPTT